MINVMPLLYTSAYPQFWEVMVFMLLAILLGIIGSSKPVITFLSGIFLICYNVWLAVNPNVVYSAEYLVSTGAWAEYIAPLPWYPTSILIFIFVGIIFLFSTVVSMRRKV